MNKRILAIIFICSSGFTTAQIPTTKTPPALKIVTAARSQIGVTTQYNGSYVSLKYPGGDVSIETGVCTDVVIRALRAGVNADLQKLVHLDMKAHFSLYPKRWGLKRTDRNIDHRRVPNLRTFFKRKHTQLPVTQNPENYLPGDIVTCTVAGKLPHIMIVSDKMTTSGEPYVIHNIGNGTQEQADLFTYPLTGHYRWK